MLWLTIRWLLRICSSLNQVLVHVDEVLVQLFGLLFGVFFIVLRLCDSILNKVMEKTLFVFRRCIDSEFEARWQSSSKKLAWPRLGRFVPLTLFLDNGEAGLVGVLAFGSCTSPFGLCRFRVRPQLGRVFRLLLWSGLLESEKSKREPGFVVV